MTTQVEADPPGIVRVLNGINPILATNKATVVEFYDGSGNLMALFFRHFSNNTWIFATKADPDWEANLIRLGYIQPKMSIDEIARAHGIPR